MVDVIIIGAGPAGLTAGIYLARKKIKTLVITKNIGGQTLETAEIENYLGFQYISGLELVKKFKDHVTKFNELELLNNTEVSKIEKLGNFFEVKTKNGKKYTSNAVILAQGKSPRRLNVPGEKKFLGHGVTYCATCDAPFYGNKVVAVVGGGNAGLEAALQLVKIAKKIYLIEIKDKLAADAILINRFYKSNKAGVLLNTKVEEIIGNKFVKSIKISQKNEIKFLEIQGLFIEIGLIPNTSFVKNLVKLNKTGEIIVDKRNKTSQEGIFAAGDVADVPDKQIIIAAGEGAKAALNCSKYLINLKT
ncbi:MAG: FAD-dependent oxidoreductase [Patescibacteria group bacterium]